MNTRLLATLALIVASQAPLTGCASDEIEMGGVHTTEAAGVVFGPAIIFEPLSKPDAELPFPNDLATVIDPDGSSHLNLSQDAPTRMERRFRRHLAEVPGFSAMSPISISFDGPLDLSTITDDSVLVINVQPDSERYGEVVPLDLGRGWFPHSAQPHAYFPHDPLGNFDSYVLPPDNKIDSDGDGKPDKWVYHYEVSTHTLDIRPLLPLEAGAKYAVVLTRAIEGMNKDGKTRGSVRSPFPFVNHSSQTNAVELAMPTLRERGLEPKDVAFAWTLTTADLSRTFQALREGLYGRGKFAWLDKAVPARIAGVEKLNIDFDGLDKAHGGHPNKKYPYIARDHDYIVQKPLMAELLGLVAQFAPETVGDGAFNNVEYAVFGDMQTPSLRQRPADETTERSVWDVNLAAGTATVEPIKVPFMITVPRTTEHHKPPFPVIVYAHATGTSRIESILLADLFARAGIAVFTIDAVGHGPVLANARDMIGGFFGAGEHRWGCDCTDRTCHADKLQPWHKPACANDKECSDQCDDEDTQVSVIRPFLGNILFKDFKKEIPDGTPVDVMYDKLLSNGFLKQFAVQGRGVDDNHDCELNGTAGEAYYAPNTFRLRDSMRQTTLDYIVAVRLLRSLTQAKVPAKIDDPREAEKTPEGTARLMQNLLAGDFNADGVLDIGGPDNHYFMTGISLGGIHTALTAPLEPYIVAAAPVVAGAGLADIFIRTRLQGVITPLMHKVSGPKVIGCATDDGTVLLSWNDDSDNCKLAKTDAKTKTWRTRKTYKAPTGECLQYPIDVPWHAGEAAKISEGVRVRVTNEVNGETAEMKATKGGNFALSVASDKGDVVRVEVLDAIGKVIETHKLVSPYEGVGRLRNTPRFRRFVQTSSNILEGADAITVAERMFLRPLPNAPETNVLLMIGVGDQTVNYAAGLALGRAIGLFGKGASYVDSKPFREWSEKTIGDGVLANKLSAPTVPLDASKPDGGPGMCNVIKTKTGRSALCLADVEGKHEYIAQPSKADRFPALAGYSDTSYTFYHRHMIVSYFHSLGTKVIQDPCWASQKCASDGGKALMKQWDAPIAAVP